MPTYTFTNTNTNETFTEFMSISECEQFLAENPHIRQEVSAPAIVDPYSVGRMQTPNGFRQVLKKIKSRNRGSTIDTGNVTEI